MRGSCEHSAQASRGRLTLRAQKEGEVKSTLQVTLLHLAHSTPHWGLITGTSSVLTKALPGQRPQPMMIFTGLVLPRQSAPGFTSRGSLLGS